MPKEKVDKHSQHKLPTKSANAPLLAEQTRQPAIPIVQLQRVVGNRAIQRMPSVQLVKNNFHVFKAKTGFIKKPLTPAKITANSAREKLVAAIADLHSETGVNLPSVSLLRMDLSIKLSNIYNSIIFAANDIITAFKDNPSQKARASYKAALEIKVEATNEKSIVLEKLHSSYQWSDNGKTIAAIISEKSTGRLYMDESKKTGTVGGAMNELTTYQGTEGTEYFKPNTESLDYYSDHKQSSKVNMQLDYVASQLPVGDQSLLNSSEYSKLSTNTWGNVNYGQYKTMAGFLKAHREHTSKQTNGEFAFGSEIDLANLQSAQREVAMSRLGMLLKSDLISKATLVLSKVDDAPQLGSLAPEVQGKTTPDLETSGNKTYKQDPALLSRLSALYMIDFLAGQSDRHQGNYIVQVAQDGRVLGLTGIDNDMSFGTKDTKDMVKDGTRVLPPLGKYFDSEMAKKIQDLDVKVLATALNDLLGSKEIAALCDRLEALKAHLKAKDTQLLQPQEWHNLVTSSPKDFLNKDYVFQVSGY